MGILMKILIVDDEQEIRDFIGRMPEWKLAGCEVVGTASNGAEAYEMMVRLQPDVLITDIKMPIMDGIVLAEKLKKERPELPIIFLTAYSDFEYARQAIKLGVVDFITKPFRPEDLIKSVNLLRVYVSHQNEWIWQDEFFAYFSHPSPTETEKLDWLQKQAIEDRPYRLVYVEMDNTPTAVHVNQPFSRLGLKDKIDVILKDEAFSYWSALSETGIYYLLFDGLFEPGDPDEPTSSHIMNLIRTIMEVCNEDAVISISIGLSQHLNSFLELTDGIYQISQCMEYRMLLGKKSIVSHEALDDLFVEHNRNQDISRNEFSLLLQRGDSSEVSGFLRSSYKRMLTEGFNKAEMQSFNMQMVDTSEAMMVEYGIQTSSDKRMEVHKALLGLNILTEMMQFLEIYLRRVVEQIQAKKVDYASRLILETKKMVERHYAEDLTLQMIADRLNVNYSYLSRIIKRETEKNFKDILVEFRIEEAKRNLAQTDLKAYEVAYAVGFKDANHFSEIFKKIVGKTPSEYREEIRSSKK
ncbi:response regulator [Paenibacillus psychroresistens]|uniref:Response regulator n=1 Tax=Paenibacillus psychroresistens TaxID=1778678 RepID=A0A6B8RUS6_9BACL|nr:response regulator [Paenibacillus psychroresistens]QGQ99504.1 response regulator [Paenibacillus psychroresistens]